MLSVGVMLDAICCVKRNSCSVCICGVLCGASTATKAGVGYSATRRCTANRRQATAKRVFDYEQQALRILKGSS